jgi:hypothetical protein
LYVFSLPSTPSGGGQINQALAKLKPFPRGNGHTLSLKVRVAEIKRRASECFAAAVPKMEEVNNKKFKKFCYISHVAGR